jgi:quinol monooxygenase YgiN
MIARLVKMTFVPEQVSDFMDMFNQRKQHIRNFEGCTHLQLLMDQNETNVIYTYSVWQSDEALDAYRSSELFAETWKQTKTYFLAKAEAMSLNELQNV